MAVHHSSHQLMLALAAQCMQTSLISSDKILISYDTEDGMHNFFNQGMYFFREKNIHFELDYTGIIVIVSILS